MDNREAWRDQILLHMLQAGARSRRGVSDADLSVRTGLPPLDVRAACYLLKTDGYVELIDREQAQFIYALTPKGVAFARQLKPPGADTQSK